MPSVIQHTHKLNHPEILSDVIHKIPMHKEDSERQWIFLGTNLPITKVCWWTLSSPGAHGLWLRPFFFLPLQTPLPISLIGCLYFLGQALRMQNLFVLSLFGRLIALCRIFRAFSVWLPDCFWKSGDAHQKHCLALVGGKTWCARWSTLPIYLVVSASRGCVYVFVRKKKQEKLTRDGETDIRWIILFWIIVQSYSLSGIFFFVVDESDITETFMSLKTRQLKGRISSIVSPLLSFIPRYFRLSVCIFNY